MSELLPCPMCGTAAHFFKIDDIDQKDFGGQGICCQTEGCVQIGLMFACMDDPKPTLAEKWNRRTVRSLERELAQANADVIEMRDILKIIANERFIPEEWERLTARVKAALGEGK